MVSIAEVVSSWKVMLLCGVVGIIVSSLMPKPPKKEPKVFTSFRQVIGDLTVLKLLDWEIRELERVPSSNTMTFFKGKVCKEQLKAKLESLFKVNPWLVGKLIKSEHFEQMALQFPTEYNGNHVPKDCFLTVTDNALTRTMSYADLSTHVSKYFVKKPVDSVDKDEPVFRVVLFEIVPDEEYALLVSMSHLIGDGYTFYAIYGMLDFDTPVKAMIVDRNHEFQGLVTEALSKQCMDWFKSPALIIAILSCILFQKKPVAHGFTVNEKEVKRIKDEFLQKKSSSDLVPFLSTNDILTSWFFRLCKSSIGLMPINFRDRLRGVTKDHAGNYEKCLLYSREDVTEPKFIRQSIIPDDNGSYWTKSRSVPTLMNTLGGNLAVVTNWASFYKDIRITTKPLVSPEDIFHRPAHKVEDNIFKDVCIIFNSNKNTLSVSCNCRSLNMNDVFSSGIEDSKLLNKKIF